MSRESQFAAVMLADDTLMAILTGGVYTSEALDVEGIHRGDDSPTAGAFDAMGYLKPTALIRQRDLIPLGSVRNVSDKFSAVRQAVEIYFYQYRGYDQIDLAKDRVYQLFEGERLVDSYPLTWVSEAGYYYDVGPVMNSMTLRQEWMVVSIRNGA